MGLSEYVETLNLLGDESRLRLCALLRERELCVTELVRLTGISQSRVSTHLGRLRVVLDEAADSGDATLEGDQRRLLEYDAERREGSSGSVAEDLERDYSPGR